MVSYVLLINIRSKFYQLISILIIFEKVLGKLDTQPSEDDNSLCRIELSLTYTKQLLVIRFSYQFEFSNLKERQVRFDTFIRVTDVDDNDADLDAINILEYRCSEDEYKKNIHYGSY